MTAVQKKLPVRIVVLNSASLDFVELEQKIEGLAGNYTDLLNPSSARLAEVMGYPAWSITGPDELEKAAKVFLAHNGPALLDVRTSSYELVILPGVEGTAAYGVRAIIEGRCKDVKKLLIDNFVK